MNGEDPGLRRHRTRRDLAVDGRTHPVPDASRCSNGARSTPAVSCAAPSQMRPVLAGAFRRAGTIWQSRREACRGDRADASSSGRDWPGWSPHPSSSPPASTSPSSSRSRRPASAARPGGRSAGCSSIDSPEQRRMGIKDSLELAEQDWAGTAGFDRDEDAWPQALGAGLPRVRRRREARLAARPRRQVLPRGRLGRTRRLHRDRPRQLGAALPHRLGHRPRPARTVRQRRCAPRVEQRDWSR